MKLFIELVGSVMSQSRYLKPVSCDLTIWMIHNALNMVTITTLLGKQREHCLNIGNVWCIPTTRRHV